MGYDLHIERPEKVSAIALEEWLDVVRADPEMRCRDVAEIMTPDGILRYESAGLAIWKESWFDFRRGRVVVKNPDEEAIAKMKQLAAKLKARVVGDEGEVY